MEEFNKILKEMGMEKPEAIQEEEVEKIPENS